MRGLGQAPVVGMAIVSFPPLPRRHAGRVLSKNGVAFSCATWVSNQGKERRRRHGHKPDILVRRRAVFEAMQANTGINNRGLLQGRGGDRRLIGHYTATLLASFAASATRPFRLVVDRYPTTRIDGSGGSGDGSGLNGSHRRRIAKIPHSGQRHKIAHSNPVHLH